MEFDISTELDENDKKLLAIQFLMKLKARKPIFNKL